MQPTSQIIPGCGSCRSTNLRSVLWLGYMHPSCSMPKIGKRATEETHYPVELLQCEECSLVQLSCVIDPEIVFYPEYPYSSGNTRALRENFAQLAAEIQEVVELQKNDLVVDIGSNDGTLLSNFRNVCRMWGVEPTNQAATAYHNGIPTSQEFFTAALAARQGNKARVITACNVMAHMPDVHDVLEGVATLLTDDGVFVTENHYLGSLIDGLQWDHVFHEHLRYYSLRSLVTLLESHGLHVFRSQRIPSHGGSFRVYASKKPPLIGIEKGNPDLWPEDRGIDEFAHQVAESKRKILRRLNESQGRIVAIGAAARGATLLNYCGIDVDTVEAVLEVAGSDKIGHYMPGTRIPVIDEEMLYREQPEYALLLPWHLADSLIPRFRAKGYRGKFILPLPTPRVVSEVVEAAESLVS